MAEKGFINGTFYGDVDGRTIMTTTAITGSTYSVLATDEIVSIGSDSMTLTLGNFTEGETKYFLNSQTTTQTLATGGTGSIVLPGAGIGSTYTMLPKYHMLGVYYDGTNYWPLDDNFFKYTSDATAGAVATLDSNLKGIKFGTANLIYQDGSGNLIIVNPTTDKEIAIDGKKAVTLKYNGYNYFRVQNGMMNFYNNVSITGGYPIMFYNNNTTKYGYIENSGGNDAEGPIDFYNGDTTPKNCLSLITSGVRINQALSGRTRNPTGSTYTTVGSDWIIECGSSTNMTVTMGSTTFLSGEVRFVCNNTTGSTVTLATDLSTGSFIGNGLGKAATFSLGSYTQAVVTRRGTNFWVNV